MMTATQGPTTVEMNGQNRPRRAKTMPRSVVALITTVGLAGAACLALRARDLGRWSPKDFLVLVGVAAATAISEQFPIQLRHRTETLDVALTDSLWAAGLVLLRPSVLTFGVAIGIMVGLTIRGVTSYKVAFNVGQYVVALSVAQVIFAPFSHGGPLLAGTWGAVALSMGVYALISSLLVTLVIALAEGIPFLKIFLPPLHVTAVHFMGNVAIGTLLAVAWTLSPAGVPLLVVPIALAYLAYRGLMRRLRDGERLRTLVVDRASDGIFMVDTNGTVVTWNPGIERITGISAADAIGRPAIELVVLPVLQSSAECQQAHRSRTFVPIDRPDGTRTWVHFSRSDIKERGKVNGTVLVVQDMSPEHEAEQLKADFLATISHELRTPLTPLKGFLTSLLNGMVDDSEEGRREYYRIMLRQSERLERLVSDLLEVSRLDGDKPLVTVRDVELASVVRDKIAELAEGTERSIEVVGADEPVVVRTDASKVRIVLENLLSNAIKYSPQQSPVTVKILVNGRDAVVSVADRGVGILQSEQPKIFERFYQGERHLRREHEGAGLGLHIAGRLVEAMCGRVWFESKVDEGSTFCFSLAVAESAGQDARPGEDASVGSSV